MRRRGGVRREEGKGRREMDGAQLCMKTGVDKEGVRIECCFDF